MGAAADVVVVDVSRTERETLATASSEARRRPKKKDPSFAAILSVYPLPGYSERERMSGKGIGIIRAQLAWVVTAPMK